jgi:putative alpha-1,2-mannosidase
MKVKINLFLTLSMLMSLMGIQVGFGQQKKNASTGPAAVNYIDPTIGNIAPFYNTNRPVVQVPNQMIRMFPKRQDHLDMQITDFPMTSLNIITPQVIFAIKPYAGALADTGWYRRLTYDHDLEVTQPWYYSVKLTDDDVLTEYTAGERTGIYRFTFPAGAKKNLLLSHYYAKGKYDLTDGTTITGVEFVDDANHQQKGMAYLYGKVSGKPESGKNRAKKTGGVIPFWDHPKSTKKWMANARTSATPKPMHPCRNSATPFRLSVLSRPGKTSKKS